MSLPTTQSIITISQTGPPSVLTYTTTAPLPSTSPTHALVRNTTAGINYIDTYFRTGLYPTFLPHTPGREAAGTIVSLPSDPSVPTYGLKVGDRVVYMGAATYAQYTAIPVDSLVKIPDKITNDIAVALWIQGLTAWTFIREAGQVKPTQWTLVHAAAGGVGGLLVQLLKSIGAKVVATASTEDKREIAKGYGADVVLDSRGDWVGGVLEATGGVGTDVVFDGVGKETFEGGLKVIARKGTFISFGNASGTVPPVPLFNLTPKNIRLLRPNVSGYLATRDELNRHASELFEKFTSGALKAPIHKVYALKDAAQAHIDIESRRTVGKLLLKID